MVKELINDYQNESQSIEQLATKYKIGKVKVKKILSDNQIPIRSKGGQVKHIEVPFTVITLNKVLSCKKCNKIFNDVENKSGGPITHIMECYPNVSIPSKLKRTVYKKINGIYWHFQYFNLIDIKPDSDKLKCPLCEWETTDLTNKTGCFTKHVEKHHENINKFIEYNKDYEKYFNPFLKSNKREIDLECELNYVTCNICNKKMKSITNTHLIKKHNITTKEYKLKFPNEKLMSKTSLNYFKEASEKANKNMTPTWTSKGEIEIMEFIKGLGFFVEKGRNRKILEGKEIDLIITEKKLCIEYDGLYYHTERMGKNSTYHLDKTIECKKMGYDLIHIFEDEWMTNKDLVKDKLKHILKLHDGIKIGGRNVTIKEINSKEKSKFLNDNHIQGTDKSLIHYGAFYKNELIGVMTFNGKRNMTKSIDGQYELSRFCVKQNHIVNGLGPKFIKHFIKEYNPKSIISFADRRWTLNEHDNFYTKIGFTLVDIIKPNYCYYNSKVDRYKRFHKFGFGKNNLKKIYPHIDFTKSEKEITTELGYDKIWDCGLFKYQMSL